MRYFYLLLCAALLSCTPTEPLYNTQSYVFGTLVDISIYGETEAEARSISSGVMRQFQAIHDRYHAWKPSQLNGINRAISQGNAVHVDAEFEHIIQEATTYSVRSQGLFNPAIGHLIETWGFHRDSFTPVDIDANTLKQLVHQNPSMADIVIQDHQLVSRNPQVKLDLGGYAKGYALDVALNMLKKEGVENALINIGGNVIALGKHGKQPWRVGIQHPRKPNAIAALDLESGWAIGTSGDYQRFFMKNGARYCHIIDPRTGKPAQGMQSVTVLIPPQPNAGVLSDIASKPIFISAPEAQAEMAKALGVEYVMLIDGDGLIRVTAAMQKRLTWLENDVQKHLQILP